MSMTVCFGESASEWFSASAISFFFLVAARKTRSHCLEALVGVRCILNLNLEIRRRVWPGDFADNDANEPGLSSLSRRLGMDVDGLISNSGMDGCIWKPFIRRRSCRFCFRLDRTPKEYILYCRQILIWLVGATKDCEQSDPFTFGTGALADTAIL